MKVDQQVNLSQTGAQVDAAEETSLGLEKKFTIDGKTHDLPNLPRGADDKEAGSKASDVQGGVKQAEAITATWSKTSLRTVYILQVPSSCQNCRCHTDCCTRNSFWLTYAVNAFQSSITSNLTAFVTSGFEEHSLIPVISIVSNVMSAVAYMVLAKILDLWDRSYGYLAMTAFATLGLILSAACTDIYTYCAAQVSSS